MQHEFCCCRHRYWEFRILNTHMFMTTLRQEMESVFMCENKTNAKEILCGS